MTEIVVAIITGMFALASAWLGHYLALRRDARRSQDTSDNVQSSGQENVRQRPWTVPSPPGGSSVVRSPTQTSSDTLPGSPTPTASADFVFYRSRVWWGMLLALPAICIGGAFLANWLLNRTAGLFGVELQTMEYTPYLLIIVGAIWGLVYTFAGALDATNLEELLFPFFDPYASLFEFFEFDEILRGIFTAIPLNVLLSLAIGHGCAYLGAEYMSGNYEGIVYVVTGVITFFSVGAYSYGR